MDVQTEHHLQSLEGLSRVSKIEILAGPTGRRRWPDDLKFKMVTESFEPNVSVREVAERYGVAANHLSTWRSLARQGKLVDGVKPYQPVSSDVEFARLEVSNIPILPGAPTLDFTELEIDGMVLRFGGSTNVTTIASLVCALRDKS